MAEYIDAGRVSKMTGMTRRTITEWARKGILPGAHKIEVGRRRSTWLFEEEKVKRFIRQQEVKACQSINAVALGGFVSSGMERKSEDRLEQLLKLKH